MTKIQNDGVTMNITYDTKGNSTATSLSADSNSSLGAIKTSATYSADGSQLMTQTNSSGYKTTYGYDDFRNLYSVKDNLQREVNQIYEVNNDRPSMTFMTGKISVQNTYTNGNLTNVNRGGYIPNDSTKYGQDYIMEYDAFGNMTDFNVGNWDVASYTYNRYKTLATITYGNNQTISYTYDDLDRVTGVTSSNGQNLQYSYSADGNLSKILDVTNKKGIYYEYDSLGRLIHSYRTTGDSGTANPSIVHWTEHLYDTENRIKTQKWHYGGTTYSETYKYDSTDGSLTSIDASYGDLSFTYDGLKRLSSRNGYYFGMNYTYRDITAGTRTTNQVSKISYVKRNSSSFPAFSLAYSYDGLGNITKVTGTTRTDQTATYSYNALGQLTSESNAKGSYTYTYDTYGNIRSVSGTESHTYTYGKTAWRDLLTAYDGVSFTYQENGNPVSYYNGTQWTLSWINGRQMSKSVSDDHTITYTYDATGVRDSKTVDGVKYTFYTSNGQVGRQYANGKYWTFLYDNQGRPNVLIYDGTVYYYVLNLQGDVIGLVNTSGTYVAQYAYDAWGKVISSSGTLADINPLRYRGYYYDSETGFYYLGSRYYDPAIKRFINADEGTISVADTTTITDKNLFAYCDNNPVMRKDDGGELWNVVAGAAIGGLLSGVSTAVESIKSGDDWSITAKKAVVSTVTGAIGGALAGSGLGVLGQSAISGGLSILEYTLHQRASGRSADAKGVLCAAVSGTVGGMLGGNGAAYGSKYISYYKKQATKRISQKGLVNATKYYAKNTWNWSKNELSNATYWGIAKAFTGSKVVSAWNSMYSKYWGA